MRIPISNPGGIGDFVLRQPEFAVLMDAAINSLVVRSETAPIAKRVAPRAQVFHLAENPYRPQFEGNSEDVPDLLRNTQVFAADV